MYRLLAVVMIMCFCSPSYADGSMRVDYSRLPYSPEIIAKIEQFMPREIEQNILKDRIPAEELGANVCVQRYYEHAGDSNSSIAIILYSNGMGKGTLIAISTIPGDDRVFGRIDDLITEAPVGLFLSDIDCDQINEIVAYSSVGAAGYQHYDIAKYGAYGLERLTERRGNNVIVGRMFEIDSTANKCPRQIRISYDGPVKYRPDTVRTFQFDAAKHLYQLESVEAISNRQK